MRSFDEVQYAHDTLWAIHTGEVELPLDETAIKAVEISLNVLCWVLKHEHNKMFGTVLAQLRNLIEGAGYAVVNQGEPKLRREDGRPIHEVELFAVVEDPKSPKLQIGRFDELNELMQRIVRSSCAQVHTPYDGGTAVYSFDVWLLHVPAGQPAIFEMMVLLARAGQMYRDFVEE